MKHKGKITLLILGMFLMAQFIGLYVVNYYLMPGNEVPLGFGYSGSDFEGGTAGIIVSIVFGIIIAVSLFLLLTKIKADFFLRLWFFLVVVIALIISLNSIIPYFQYSLLLSGIIALTMGFFKVYKRSLLVHNAAELLVYPGIAAIFVPILSFWAIIILLIIISLYDMWAVWHSGIMQKMAKYQINKLKTFSGFFVPYISRKVRLQIKSMTRAQLKRKKIKINVAILGGGDVVFPIITSGVMLASLGLYYALFTIGGAALGLSYILLFSKKKKFYPAMPFITAGIFAGLLVGLVISLL